MIASDVRDIMVPLENYPQVHEDATLRDAFAALRAGAEAGRFYRHVLVLNQHEQLIGMIGMRNLLRGLFPDYLRADEHSRFEGASSDVAGLAMLWRETCREQCQVAGTNRVRDFMSEVKATIAIDAPVTLAAYLMVSRGVSMLPVIEKDRVVGACRLPDVFNEASEVVLHD
jgi:CBS domain-containing protein